MNMISKYLVTPIKQRFYSAFVSQKQWEEWSVSWKFFFILAQGRSGTKFLANLLNQAQGTHVFHEPVVEDFCAYLKAFHNPKKAENYIQKFRKKEIYHRMYTMPVGVYGEVNSILRDHVNVIKKIFPQVTLIHLVRDGRDVVRSIMSRNVFTIKSPYSMAIYPSEFDPWRELWPRMNRFARSCWYWQEENRRLRVVIGRPVQFERLLSSYEYFTNEVLEPCGIQISKTDWQMALTSPRNTTSEFSMPKWSEWTLEQQKTFKDICGDEMEKCGYSF